MARGLLALFAVVAVIVLVVLMARSPSNETGGFGAKPDLPEVATGPLVLPVKIVLECETPSNIVHENELKIDTGKDGLILKDQKTGTVLMEVKQHSEGQLIRYLEIPDGWIESCFKDRKGIAGALPGKLAYEFEAPRDDTYFVNLRAKWMDSCGNSVWVKVDDGEWLNLEDENGKIAEKNYKWAWHPLFVGGKAKAYSLKKGKHTLWLNTREDGPCLDQWLVSTEASVPVGGAITIKP